MLGTWQRFSENPLLFYPSVEDKMTRTAAVNYIIHVPSHKIQWRPS